MLNYTSLVQNESQTDYKSNKDNNFQHESIVIINCVLNAPLMLTSIIGNALVLAAILRTPSLRSASNVFLCSLALSDLLVGLIVQPVYIVASFQFVPDSPLMFTYHVTTSFVCGVSLGTMTAISVDRFLALHYHMQYPNLITTKRAEYASAAIWFISIVLTCVRVLDKKSYFLTIAVGIVICLLVSSLSYIRIYRIVRRHQLQINVQQQAVQISNAEHNLNSVQKTKGAINAFIYFIFMILCYSPMFIFTLVYANFPSMRLLKVWWILVNAVTFMNSTINPLLYCRRSYELRTAILKLLRNIFVKQRVEN